MKNRKKVVSLLAGLMAAVMLLTLVLSLLPRPAYASSSEIRKQINQLQKEKEEVKKQIAEVKEQYKENEDEIADIIGKKAVIDQEIQLLSTQIENINQEITAYNTLIADKQDELDNATARYRALTQDNRTRVRAMEEEGTLSYWEVLFKANSFSDLLDRLNMVEEINASDKRRLGELEKAAREVESAQEELELEKVELEGSKTELDETQLEMNSKREEADALIQELFSKADDLEALKAEYEQKEEDFLTEIANMEIAYTAAKKAEWEAYMATYVPPTTAAAGSTGNPNSNTSTSTGSSGGGTAGGGGGTWLVPCSYTSITSPFGHRVAPTTGASTFHQGVDLDSTTGYPVVASRAGIVTVAGYGSAAGNYVQINHQDGFSSIYMHLNSYSVRAGQVVSAGQNIGTVGATGVATGDHLHFGISYNGVYVNPCAYVNL